MTLTESPPSEPIDKADLYDSRGSAVTRLPKLPFELFLLLVIGVILLVVVLVLGRVSLGEAETAQTDAEQELTIAESTISRMRENAEVAQLAQIELSERVDDLTASLAATGAAAAAAPPGDIPTDLVAASELTDAQNQITDLSTQLADMTAARTELQAALDAANSAVNAGDDASTVAAPTPAFDQYVGEVLASADGVRINADQSRCLGQAVIVNIGLDAVGAGLNKSKTSESNTAVVTAVIDAAATCDIPTSRIFGQ